MNRLLVPLALMLALAVSPASAAVHVRAAVVPDSIQQCGSAHWTSALWNTGSDTLRVRVAITLTWRDSFPLGTLAGRTVLLPGEVRTRDFDFTLPANIPPGAYGLVIRATASDGSADLARVHIVALAASCPDAPVTATPTLDLMNGVSSGMGLDPDSTTPTLHDTWGALKARYRR